MIIKCSKILQFLSYFIFLFIIVFKFNSFSQNTMPGIDVLAQSDFDVVSGKKIAILTNYTGRSISGKSSVEILQNSGKCTVVSVFTPEHGFYTTVPAGEHVSDDSVFGLPVYSLYGDNRRPKKSQLADIESIVIDIQDVGIRSYTYISTIYKVMDAAAEYGKEVIILDRPNPLGGLIVDGNIIESGKESFIGIVPISYIHGLTIAEFALMVNGEGWLPKGLEGEARKCDLKIVKMKNWSRWMAWEDTGLLWYPTSPHVPTIDAVRGMAVIGAFGELAITSIGIGTTLPFQYIGSPDLKTNELNNQFNSMSLNGLQLIQTKYRPFYGKYSNKDCQGFMMRFPIDNLFQPYTSGFRIMLAMRKIEPQLFEKSRYSSQAITMFEKATGSSKVFEALMNGTSDTSIYNLISEGLDEYRSMRRKYLLYE